MLVQEEVFSNLISIHAPARGATIVAENTLEYKHISIHAPARGATCVLLFTGCH